MNILRGSRVKKSSEKATRFTSSIEFDAPIAKHVVKINIAHMLSLLRCGEVNPRTAVACVEFLLDLPEQLKPDKNTEDVHHMIEQEAIRKIGMDRAGYINLGKSRNDQVSAAIRMEARERTLQLCAAIVSLQGSILQVSKRFGDLLIPGYTHLQHAQPLTLAFHMQSYFDAFERDFARLSGAFARVNLSPMGAAALAGTSVAVDRRYVASILGFDGLVKNAMDAVASRDFAVELAALSEICMINLSRMSEEIMIWSSSEFGFVEVSDEHAATSSIMPQKKNPVVAETIRAKCGSVLGSLSAICSILKALPNSYNLDLQEVTPHLWSALRAAVESTGLMADMLSAMKFSGIAFAASLDEDKSTATELANHLVRRHGIPFRQAHAIVGELVSLSLKENSSLVSTVLREITRVSSKIAGRAITLGRAEAERVLDATKTLSLIRSQGGANPRFTRSEQSQDAAALKKNEAWLNARRSDLISGERLLQREIRKARKEVRN